MQEKICRQNTLSQQIGNATSATKNIISMKTFLSLLPFILLAQGSYAQEQSTPPQTAKTTPKIIKASSGAAPTGQHRPRHVTPYPPSGQAYFQRPARWEYYIFEIRIRESEIGGGVFQLHMPGRSSGRNKDLGKISQQIFWLLRKLPWKGHLCKKTAVNS